MASKSYKFQFLPGINSKEYLQVLKEANQAAASLATTFAPITVGGKPVVDVQSFSPPHFRDDANRYRTVAADFRNRERAILRGMLLPERYFLMRLREVAVKHRLE